MRYDKLVRDKIIEIIEAKNESAKWHVANETEYGVKLKEKFLEEVKEFNEAENIEEMANIFEVITAWCALKGWTIDDVLEVQEEKRSKRGGFEKRIILEES